MNPVACGHASVTSLRRFSAFWSAYQTEAPPPFLREATRRLAVPPSLDAVAVSAL
eukprot:CAMPEP_0119543244 /NCGR_PEP_ID=MMETSP1344-20130328/54016_1 /TAXON_ID=236787 /ORGANISM="Florenciella parvula, Strain CCMP2471" /LENGTH=54 /DNA_ID=CAMNT_0007587525 /DNA_START=209 /DNA_END=373 /DNA_ORIENTATION=-